MNSVIVMVEAAAGCFRATAKRGPREHEATATSPDFAVRLAAAGLFGVDAADITAVRHAHGAWTATVRAGAILLQTLACLALGAFAGAAGYLGYCFQLAGGWAS